GVYERSQNGSWASSNEMTAAIYGLLNKFDQTVYSPRVHVDAQNTPYIFCFSKGKTGQGLGILYPYANGSRWLFHLLKGNFSSYDVIDVAATENGGRASLIAVSAGRNYYIEIAFDRNAVEVRQSNRWL